MDRSVDLSGTVALVAGATRGAGRGIAVELGAAGATVYCTGRTTRDRTSEYGRPETIEDTAELVTTAGGTGVAVACDHLDSDAVRALVDRIDDEHGRLDVLVNDIWGAEYMVEWDNPVWAHSLDKGLRTLRLAIDTHLVTAHHALRLLKDRPGGLVVEVTDGTAAYNAENYRDNVYYDLAKIAPIRLARAWAHELAPYGGTAVAVTPGWLRSEIMLELFGVTETTWRDALVREPHGVPDGAWSEHFAISETPRFVGRGIAALAADPDRHRWNAGSTSSGELGRVYGRTARRVTSGRVALHRRGLRTG